MPHKDPKTRRAYKAAYYLAHREKIRAQNAAYYLAHREEISAYKAARYQQFLEFYYGSGLVELLSARFGPRMDHGSGEGPLAAPEGSGA